MQLGMSTGLMLGDLAMRAQAEFRPPVQRIVGGFFLYGELVLGTHANGHSLPPPVVDGWEMYGELVLGES